MVIGISGKIGSGKDAFADLFIEHVYEEYGAAFENKKFAYNLKKIVRVLAGIPMEDVLSREGKLKYLPEWGMTVGEMQQKVGTEAVRNNIHNDAWVLSLFGTYKEDEDYWIVTDVRFKNEAEIIKKKGGVIIRLEGDPNNSRAGDDRNMSHQSEIDLDDYVRFDYVYQNVPPISYLEDFVKIIAKKVFSNELVQ